jgi:hypothetical protein
MKVAPDQGASNELINSVDRPALPLRIELLVGSRCTAIDAGVIDFDTTLFARGVPVAAVLTAQARFLHSNAHCSSCRTVFFS